MQAEDEPATIVAAAIKQDGMVCSVPRPGRHHDVIRAMAGAGISIPIIGEQGFLTSDGEFVGRKDAKVLATFNGQIITDCRRGSTDLFSEDVW